MCIRATGEVVRRSDPEVEHAIDRLQVTEPLAVRAEPRLGAVGVAEEDLTGNQGSFVGHGVHLIFDSEAESLILFLLDEDSRRHPSKLNRFF